MPIGRIDHYARVMAETERGNEMERVERGDLTILGCDCYRLKAENDRLREIATESIQNLGPLVCDICGRAYASDPLGCVLADHVEAWQVIEKYRAFKKGAGNE